MKWLFVILIAVMIIAIAVFTGSWIFDILATLFNFIVKAFQWLSEMFNFFGWNNGIL